jgi:hypothetical protein
MFSGNWSSEAADPSIFRAVSPYILVTAAGSIGITGVAEGFSAPFPLGAQSIITAIRTGRRSFKNEIRLLHRKILSFEI